MMEQADAGEGHYHVIFITGCDDILITDGTARLCDILNAALVSALNVVAEGEEGIGTKGNAGQLIQPCAFFFSRKNGRLLCENLLPGAVRADIHIFLTDVNIDGVVSLCPLDILAEGQVQRPSGSDEGTSCLLSGLPDGYSVHGTAGLRPRRWPVRLLRSRRSWTGCILRMIREMIISLFAESGKLFILQSRLLGDQRISRWAAPDGPVQRYNAVHLLVLDRSRYCTPDR